jgi:hypothetical protein
MWIYEGLSVIGTIDGMKILLFEEEKQQKLLLFAVVMNCRFIKKSLREEKNLFQIKR